MMLRTPRRLKFLKSVFVSLNSLQLLSTDCNMPKFVIFWFWILGRYQNHDFSGVNVCFIGYNISNTYIKKLAGKVSRFTKIENI